MRIYVFNPSFLGDSVLTTPLIRALKTRYPDASITFTVRPEFSGLFDGSDIVNEVLPFDKRGKHAGFGGLVSFVKEVRERTFDIAVFPHTSVRSGLVALFSKIPVRVGFTESALAFAFTHSVSREMSLHEVHRNLRLVRPVVEEIQRERFSMEDTVESGGQPVTALDDAALAGAKELFGDGTVIGLNPGSVWATKRWPVERYAALSDILSEAGHTTVLFGGPGDAPVTDEFTRLAKKPFINLAGKTRLSELPAYIKALDLLVTNDSGPLHIAVSQGVPTVSIFGPTVRELGFFPYDETSLVVETEDLSCRPCGLHGHDECPKDHFRCMLEIKTETVLKAVTRQLEKIDG